MDKLKKSCFAILFIFCSCVSNQLIVPVPGQGSAKIKNIYIEYYNIAETYYGLEDYYKASEYYQLAMHKKEQYWAAYYKLAKCYVFQSDWNNALPMYKKLLSRDAENASLKASVAYIYSMQGNYKRAKKIYEELLTIQPENQEYIENYIAVLLSNEKSIKKNPDIFLEYLDILKNYYPDNKNINLFEEKYKYIMEISDDESDIDSEAEDDIEDDDEDLSEIEDETNPES